MFSPSSDPHDRVWASGYQALSVSRLGRLLGVGNPTASIPVQRLVERDLVTRSVDATDRRQAVVRLSAKGRHIAAGRLKAREGQRRNWLSRLDDQELAALARGMTAPKEVVLGEPQPSLRRGGEG